MRKPPPLPPKIKSVGRCGIIVIRKDAEGIRYYQNFYYGSNPVERAVTCAYIEVVWTKRSERWGKVRDWIQNRINKIHRMRRGVGLSPDHGFGLGLIQQIMKKENDCKLLAAAWREWGENPE